MLLFSGLCLVSLPMTEMRAMADDDKGSSSSKENEGGKEKESEGGTGKDASVQSKARPFGLDIVGKVKVAGSDARSADFQKNIMPRVEKLIDTRLGETHSINSLEAISLDTNKLKLKTDADVRVYFAGEGAGYHNTLGFNTQGVGIKTGDPKLIFPDASSSINYLSNNKNPQRTNSEPLLPGDFVNLGKFGKNTQLDFFLIADGANGGKNVYTAHKDQNPDKIQHTVAFVVPDSPFLLISFEDLYGGGDRDYNDTMFVVDIGKANVKALSGPEPSTFALLGTCGTSLLFYRRRRTVSENN